MPYSDIYLYSPLSIKTVQQGHNKALLLQFILSELFHAMDVGKKEDPLEFVFTSPACFFPNDWSYEVGCLNKIGEHAELLPYAFPNLQESTNAFRICLDISLAETSAKKKQGDHIPKEEMQRKLHDLYVHLEPFLVACKNSQEFLLFLCKNREEIEELAHPGTFQTLLAKMFPDDPFPPLPHFDPCNCSDSALL
jgi:hypothetical protein